VCYVDELCEFKVQHSLVSRRFTSIYFQGKWKSIRQPKLDEQQVVTGIHDTKHLIELAKASVATPQGFKVHQRLARTHVQSRLDAVQKAENDITKRTIDWSTAEAIAFGSLLNQGKSIRITGQDVERGTF
jgi:probable 2-oxoglutarate dehydrogenase E1 component DHKTD1